MITEDRLMATVYVNSSVGVIVTQTCKTNMITENEALHSLVVTPESESSNKQGFIPG